MAGGTETNTAIYADGFGHRRHNGLQNRYATKTARAETARENLIVVIFNAPIRAGNLLTSGVYAKLLTQRLLDEVVKAKSICDSQSIQRREMVTREGGFNSPIRPS